MRTESFVVLERNQLFGDQLDDILGPGYWSNCLVHGVLVQVVQNDFDFYRTQLDAIIDYRWTHGVSGYTDQTIDHTYFQCCIWHKCR